MAQEISKLAIVIKSFMRPVSLLNLITSINQLFLNTKVFIDDETDNLSEGRNNLVDAARFFPFILFCDDDYVMIPDNNILKVTEIMEATDMDIVCGKLFDIDGTAISHEKNLRIKDKSILKLPPKDKGCEIDGLNFKRVDMGLNFFIAKTKIFKKLRWDNKCNINTEHLDFFLSAKKAKVQVYYCPEMTAIHRSVLQGGEYGKLRARIASYPYFAKKWKINKCIEGDIITTYKEDK